MTTSDVAVAPTLQWREDAPDNLVKLAVGRCMVAVMDDKWSELGLLTNTTDRIQNHSRLLRSLRFHDEDYPDNVYSVVPDVLGERKRDVWGAPSSGPTKLRERFLNLDRVTDFLDLPAWLALNEPGLLDQLFVTAQARTMPDGTVVTAAESAATRLGVEEMRRQVERIRRDHTDDPEAAIGQAKDLIESTCKTILGMSGPQAETPDLPKLVKRTLLHLGADPTQVADDADPAEARAATRLMGGVSNILHGADELRNARGTGHGRSGIPEVDAALARLAVGAVLPAVTYLVELYERRTEESETGTVLPTASSSPDRLVVGDVVEHESFGEGRLVHLEGAGKKLIAMVDFGGEVGRKRLLVIYARLRKIG